jgi:tetratricopeptide (TPR) repeat protein
LPTVSPPEVKAEGVDPSVAAAITAARQKVLDDPRSAAAWGELGKLLLAHTFETEAEVCFERAEKLDPDDGRWPYYRGLNAAGRDPVAAVGHFRDSVAGRHPNPAYASVARLRLAEALLDRQEYGAAAKLFEAERGSEVESSRARAVYGLGLVAVMRDDLTAAARHLAAAAATPFARRKASGQLARIARLRGDADAVGRYEQDATRPPPDRGWPDPFVAESNRLRVGQQKSLQEADALARRGQLPQAAALLAELSRQYPNELTYQATGAVLIQMGDYAQAEQALRTCLGFDPGHPQAHHLLATALFLHGESLWNRGERDRARELFRGAAEHGRRAAERKPDFAGAYTCRGRALLYLGERDEAVASLRKAVECRPEVADGHLYLGEALAEAGKPDEARASLKTAEQLAGPNDPRPRQALAKLEGKKP